MEACVQGCRTDISEVVYVHSVVGLGYREQHVIRANGDGRYYRAIRRAHDRVIALDTFMGKMYQGPSKTGAHIIHPARV